MMSILNAIKSLFIKPTIVKDFARLEQEIILIAGDSGDGACREAIVSCVKVWLGNAFSDDEINSTIDKMLHNGTLLTDGQQIIDPATIKNGAKRINDGWYLMTYEAIKIPPNTCPKCFNGLDQDGKCLNAQIDCWKC